MKSLSEGPNPVYVANSRVAGEPFNPFHEACGFFPQDVVGELRKLPDQDGRFHRISHGQKRLYARLVRFAGRDGQCYPSQERLASDLGVTARQIRSDLTRLALFGLIETESRDPQHNRDRFRRNNTYYFLWHPAFANRDRRATSASSGAQSDLSKKIEGKHTSAQNRPPTARNPVATGSTSQFDRKDASAELHQGKTSGKSSSCWPRFSGRQRGGDQHDDDPHLTSLSHETTRPSEIAWKDSIRKNLLGFIEAMSFSMPSGKIPVEAIADRLTAIGAGSDDLTEFLRKYRDNLRDPPATWKHVLVSFEGWAAKPETQALIRRRVAWELAIRREREQRVQMDRDLVARTFTPLTPVEKIEPAAFVPRSTSQKCPRCRDSGRIGTALQRTLAWCDCQVGVAARQEDGDNLLDRETEIVNSSIQTQLVAAARELKLHFAADSLADAGIVDDGATIWITGIDLFMLQLDDVGRALKLLGVVRKVVIGNQSKARS